jgi:hypothetical protein
MGRPLRWCVPLILAVLGCNDGGSVDGSSDAIVEGVVTRTSGAPVASAPFGGLSMAYILAAGVEQEIRRAFTGDDIDHVRSQLATQTLWAEQNGPPPRVHIAVIWLSKGDRRRFDTELANACADWRDTLVAAGLGNADWKQVLEKRGVTLDGIDISV